MSVKVYEPILCPGCGQVRGVNNDGRIRAHDAERRSPLLNRWGTGERRWNPRQCDGTYMKVPAASVAVRGGLW